MKFLLIDRIDALVPGERITASKALSLAEEYLADHFPTFPVLPGVLMIEAMVQSASWLWRATQDFAVSLIWLTEARNVTYKSFVAPGQVLTVQVSAKSMGSREARFEGLARCGDQEMVKARLTLQAGLLADQRPEWQSLDEELIAEARRQFKLLGGPAALEASTSSSPASRPAPLAPAG
jgi:3-hydroxyacyl-[acyl-carrier-protein] dehydratase